MPRGRYRNLGKRKCRNPNWGNHAKLNRGVEVTAFELKVRELGLTPEQYVRSEELRKWARDHRRNKYVPEDLLHVWGLDEKFNLLEMD